MRSASPWCGNVDDRRGAPGAPCPRARSRPRRGRAPRSQGAAPRRRAAASAAARRVAPPRRGRAGRVPPPPRGGRRRRSARRGRAARSGAAQSLSGVVLERKLARRTRSRGGVDRRVVDRMERALGERGEGADVLDLVAEKLDAERLATGAREDVDEPAPHRDLAALLDPLYAVVARVARASRRGRRVLLRPPRGGGSRWRARASGAMPSASARAETQTSPPRARTSSARARSPTRCAGGSSPDPGADAAAGKERDTGRDRRTNRPPRRRRAPLRPRRAGRRAVGRASRGARRGRAASKGSETRAFAGKPSTNAAKRSLAASDVDEWR